MAAMAEAKASWNQTANFCPSEDGAAEFQKRSTSSSSAVPGDAMDGLKHIIPDCKIYETNFPYAELGTGTKWWLHRKPCLENYELFSFEQLNSLDTELEVLGVGSVCSTAKLCGESQVIEEYYSQTYSRENVGLSNIVASTRRQNESNDENSGIQDLEGVCYQSHRPKIGKDTIESWCEPPIDMDTIKSWWAESSMQMEPDKYCLSEQSDKLSSDMESLLIGVDKTGPWWRTSDKDDLGSSVSCKTMEPVENCDQPRAASLHLGRKQFFYHNQNKSISSFAQMQKKEGHGVALGQGATVTSPSGNPSFTWNDAPKSMKLNHDEFKNKSTGDLSKAQLLEALCHSQTRARAAEEAAQAAYDEKEHILRMFLRQASELFAYKQWLQILQLECLCLQLRSEEGLPVPIPAVFPWTKCKGKRKKRGDRCRVARRHGHPHKMGKCAVAFAVGFGLASAGLLLGWTMGWLFPAI